MRRCQPYELAVLLEDVHELIVDLRVELEFLLKRVRKELQFGELVSLVVVEYPLEQWDVEEGLLQRLSALLRIGRVDRLPPQIHQLDLRGISSPLCESMVSGAGRQIVHRSEER